MTSNNSKSRSELDTEWKQILEPGEAHKLMKKKKKKTC